jgi:hypothetical protein
MKERPILFSCEMVRAILEDRKTQTRRVIKPGWWRCLDPDDLEDRTKALLQCPYGQVGDHLWVRETWARVEPHPFMREKLVTPNEDPRLDDTLRKYWSKRIIYKADYRDPVGIATWRPSIHMPRWVSRITLDVMGVRIERLQDISEEDCCCEMGCPATWPGPGSEPYRRDLRGCFKILWDSINTKRGYSWDVNPFVWVISFRRV